MCLAADETETDKPAHGFVGLPSRISIPSIARTVGYSRGFHAAGTIHTKMSSARTSPPPPGSPVKRIAARAEHHRHDDRGDRATAQPKHE